MFTTIHGKIKGDLVCIILVLYSSACINVRKPYKGPEKKIILIKSSLTCAVRILAQDLRTGRMFHRCADRRGRSATVAPAVTTVAVGRRRTGRPNFGAFVDFHKNYNGRLINSDPVQSASTRFTTTLYRV